VWLDLTVFPCRLPASQKTTSPPEGSILSSSSAGGSQLLVIQTRIWTFSRLYAVLVHEFIIDHLRHVPFRVLGFASLSIASRVDDWNESLVRGLFLSRTLYVEHSEREAGHKRNVVTCWACTFPPSSIKLDLQ
jgi:hypothetical protein